MAWKDSYSAAISSIALIVSCTTAYFQLFRVHIDAQMLVGGNNYPVYGVRSGGISSIYWDDSLTLINNGNRPFAVQKIGLSSFSMRTLDDTISDCDYLMKGGGIILAGTMTEPSPASFTPTVVEPGKMIILHPAFTADPEKEKTPAYVSAKKEPEAAVRQSITAPEEIPLLISSSLPDGKVNLISCITVQIVDHEGGVHSISRAFAFTERTTSGDNEGEGVANFGPFGDGTPIDLSTPLRSGRPAR